MKSSVLIVAEGEHELAGGHVDAALPTLVRRLLGDGIDLQVSSKVQNVQHAGMFKRRETVRLAGEKCSALPV